MTEGDSKLFTKKFTFLLSGLCFFGLSHSLDVKPFGQFFLPADVTIAKDSKSVSSETEWETTFVVEAGLEALFSSEFLPMRSGVGLGFRTSQRDDDARANCGVGSVLPKGFTVEASIDYSSMLKSYDGGDLTYRVSGFRFGILFGMNIEVFHSRVYKADN